MEPEELKQKIETLVPGLQVQIQKSSLISRWCIWVDREDLWKLAGAMKSGAEFGFTVLEAITAVHVEKKIMLSYFLQTANRLDGIILRTSLELPKGEDVYQMDSVDGLWKSAGFFEQDLGQLFGIRFLGGSLSSHHLVKYVFENKKFPLRRNRPGEKV